MEHHDRLTGRLRAAAADAARVPMPRLAAPRARLRLRDRLAPWLGRNRVVAVLVVFHLAIAAVVVAAIALAGRGR